MEARYPLVPRSFAITVPVESLMRDCQCQKDSRCALARARLAVPICGAIDISEDQVTFMVQCHLRAMAIYRGLGVCRPYDGPILAVGEPDGEGESIPSNFIEATREIGVW